MSYKVRRMQTSGLGLDLFKMAAPVTATANDKAWLAQNIKVADPNVALLKSFQVASPGLAASLGGASNLALGAAVVGVGLAAYLMAKALKK